MDKKDMYDGEATLTPPYTLKRKFERDKRYTPDDYQAVVTYLLTRNKKALRTIGIGAMASYVYNMINSDSLEYLIAKPPRDVNNPSEHEQLLELFYTTIYLIRHKPREFSSSDNWVHLMFEFMSLLADYVSLSSDDLLDGIKEFVATDEFTYTNDSQKNSLKVRIMSAFNDISLRYGFQKKIFPDVELSN